MDTFNTAFNCGSFLLPWNAVMLALGILAAVIVTEILVKKRGLYKDLALDACIVGIPCGIVGGRLFSALSGKIAFASILNLSETGMNLTGAMLFSCIGILIYLIIKKFNIAEAFDCMMPGAFFGLAVGRWSDFFLCDGLGPVIGEGVPKFFPLATFTNAYFHDHETVAYAVFFWDFLVCLALGLTALLLLKRKLCSGRTACITGIVYLFAEFILEWLRDGETRQIVFGEMRFNQVVLLGMLLILVVLAVVSKKPQPVACPAQEPQEPVEEATESSNAAAPEEPAVETQTQEASDAAEPEEPAVDTETQEASEQQTEEPTESEA